jgi:protease-4
MTDETQQTGGKSSLQFEQVLASEVARELLNEQRRHRRWGIFFKLLLAVYLFILLIIWVSDRGQLESGASLGGKHTAVVDVSGLISADSQASADNIISGLRAAYKSGNTAGIILRINSPGGSPVQAGYVNDEIRRLREKHPDIPVYAVVRDICASGGYYIAAAADEIYADKASIVGSIGVIMSGFGFTKALDKLGIERRVRTAGDNKAFLDPFSPLKEEDAEHIDRMLNDIHRQFIDVVKQGRGDKLADNEELFSGLVWTGEQSLELGLVDALGSTGYVAREIIGAENIVDYTHRPSYLDRFARRLGSALADRLYTDLYLNIN